MIIKDGKGGGYSAWVDSLNRLHTQSTTQDELFFACTTGNAYNFNSGSINLTSANESAIAWFSYGGDDPFVITEVLYIISGTTGGTGDGTAKIYKNPTGGTIEDNALPFAVATNRDFSSSKTFTASAYKGAEGYTITGGTLFADSSRSSFGTVITFDAAPIVLRKGSVIAFSWTPPSGNTSQDIKIAGTGYVLSSEVGG